MAKHLFVAQCNVAAATHRRRILSTVAAIGYF